MITKKTLDDYFRLNPGLKDTMKAALPAFTKDKCYRVEPTSSGQMPRKTFHVHGKRHIISVRALTAYLVLDDYGAFMPEWECCVGCINPHHQTRDRGGYRPLESAPHERTLSESFAHTISTIEAVGGAA